MQTEMNNLLQLGNIHGQLFSYETTFEMGDFYVSALLIHHVIFHGPPVIPVAFLLHERKLESSHDEFMKFIASEFPTLRQRDHPVKFPLVTDEEKAICSAIDVNLPGVIRLRCWNHTISAVKLWLKHHKAESPEIPVYVGNFPLLFHSSSLKEYQSTLENLKVCRLDVKYSALFMYIQYIMWIHIMYVHMYVCMDISTMHKI